MLEIPDEQQVATILQLLNREKISYWVENPDVTVSAALYADLKHPDSIIERGELIRLSLLTL